MKTRNKIILGLVVIILLALAGGVYYVVTNLDALVKAAIEKYGSEATKTAVRVERVHISLGGGSGTITGLTIANPSGFAAPTAFSLGEIHTAINTKALTDKKIVIDEVRILAPQITYEMNTDKQGNLNVLKDNLVAATPKQTGPVEKKPEGKPLVLTIRHVILQDAALHATLVPLNNKQYDLKLPKLEMTNLNGTPAQIARQILTRLTDHARAEIQKSAIGQEIDKFKDEANAKMEEKKAELKAKGDEKLEAEKQKAKDKLKSLLGR
jgi:uncharacterized protein involved in outer membrane biogenesis